MKRGAVAMDLADLFRRRTFQSPLRPSATETVGIHSIVFTLILGPLYLWRKRARIEAAVLLTLSAGTLVYDPQSALISADTLDTVTTLVWLATGLLAPLVLAMSYRRQGWLELADAG